MCFRDEKRKNQTANRRRGYGSCEELSEMAGTGGRSIFGITDPNFANVILDEIDKDGEGKGGVQI